MRIRLKKGVALFGTIAGAAIATALIVYNVNQGNSLNTSDMENSGLLDEVEEALGVGHIEETTQALVADADGVGAAAAAGLMGGAFADKADAPEAQTTDSAPEQAPAAEENNTAESTGTAAQADTGYSAPEGVQPAGVQADTPAQEVSTYVEAVPQTRTETVVNEQSVVVETPVTVTEQITEEVEADPGDFKAQSSAAVSGEMTTTRREQEARAAYEADQARLKAAAEAAQKAAEEQGFEEKTGDSLPEYKSSGDTFIVFY